jgi:small-conductance mechanosensitive channel
VARWNVGGRYLPAIFKRARIAFRVLILLIGTAIIFASIDRDSYGWMPALDHLLRIAIIAAFTWLLTCILQGLEDVTVRRLTEANALEDVRYRRAVTQVTLVRRLAAALVVLIGVAFVLRTFPSFSTIGTTLIASAGLLSIVAGIAAQTTLTNVFAGIQLATSNELRVGDIVSIDGQSGVVHEVTLTYVVVQLWWERSLVVPTSHFISHPFENWTRSRGRISGRSHLDVDWATPVDELRTELERVVQTSSLWDGRLARIRVIDATGTGPMRLAIDLSAGDTDALFALDALVRESLVAFIVRTNPSWLPHVRHHASGVPVDSAPPFP